MSTKQAIVLWASGCLTAVLMFAMFHTILHTELVAARQAAARTQQLHGEIQASLSSLQRTMAAIQPELEQIVDSSHHADKQRDHLVTHVDQLEVSLEQMTGYSKDAAKKVDQLVNAVTPMALGIEQIAGYSQDAAKKVDTLVNAVTPMALGIEQIAGYSQHAARQGDAVVNSVNQMALSIQQLIARVEALEARLELDTFP